MELPCFTKQEHEDIPNLIGGIREGACGVVIKAACCPLGRGKYFVFSLDFLELKVLVHLRNKRTSVVANH